MQPRSDAGQTTIEWLGLAAVVAALVMALAGFAPSLVGEEVQEGTPPLVGLTVGPAPLDMDALETSLTTGAFDPGSEVVDSTDVDVAGADAARVVEIVYPNAQELGFDLREQMLLVLDQGNAAVLRVAAPQEQWQGSRATYEAIIDSFSFT